MQFNTIFLAIFTLFAAAGTVSAEAGTASVSASAPFQSPTCIPIGWQCFRNPPPIAKAVLPAPLYLPCCNPPNSKQRGIVYYVCVSVAFSLMLLYYWHCQVSAPITTNVLLLSQGHDHWHPLYAV